MGTQSHHRRQYQEGAEVRTVPTDQERTRAGQERAPDDDCGQPGFQEGGREDHGDHIQHPEMGVNATGKEDGSRDPIDPP